MKWSLYGVFGKRADGTPIWGLTTNKRAALQTAKTWGGYVRAMPYRDATSSWDAPTFRVCSDLVADFR